MHGRRLAGAVSTDEGDDLTFPDLEGQAFKGVDGTIIYIQVGDFQQHIFIPSFSRRDRP